MQCTPQEIEEKRRQAQERLSRKTLISNINIASSNLARNGSNANFNNSASNFNMCTSPKVVTPDKFSSINQNGMKSPMNSARSSVFNAKPYEKPKQAAPFYGKQNVINGACVLISEDRFAIELSGYSAAAIDTFKTIPSRAYNAKTRHWDFHMNDYDLVLSRVALLQPDVVIAKLPLYVVNCCRLQKPDYSKIDLSSIDGELLAALMPFQEEGVCFGIDKQGRCLIADEMGLGKTFQALAIASYYKSDWPVLIATTASMKNVWEGTIHKYMPSVSVMHTQYMVSGKDYIGDAKILIVSHDMMSRCIDKLLERKFGIFIVDESHTLKNFKAKCTKAAIDLAKLANRVILLSGTPAVSRPSELYSQLAMLDEKFFGNFFVYSKRYCDGKSTQFGWDATGQSNLRELEIILVKKFMIRRTKDDVLKSLPDKVQEVVMLDVQLNQLTDADRKSLNALAANYNKQKRACDKQAALLTFFFESAKLKIPSVCSYILQTLETTQKFMVFAHHQKMLDAIEQVLVKKKLKYIRIDGNTTSDQRKFFVDKFQLDDDYVCAILSIKAANAGITLTAAKLVLFAELHWNPSILSQAESRAHRMGQDGKVVVKYLLAPGTVDDHMWPLLQKKQMILKEAGLFKDSFDNVAITKQEITNKKPIAECLQSDITAAGTLDITSYFNSPRKNCDAKGSTNTASSALDSSSHFKSPNKSDMDVFFEDSFNDSYFKSPRKTSADAELSNFKENCNKAANTHTTKNDLNVSDAELEFFNDDFDDMLSNVELNV